MKVVVTKNPDGVSYMTKDGHGDIFDKDVPTGKTVVKFGDNSIRIVPDPYPLAEDGALVVEFSWVDYLDTANREQPGKGVRHTEQRSVPGRFDFGAVRGGEVA